jgi:glutamine synthetase
METLQKVALRHDFVCLLHEKPFAGVNGSGKHVNWSVATNDGINLLDPGHTPHDNLVFLVMLSAVIRAVDKYAKLLRASVANSGNEHRLGANEAPPAIVSIFLGDRLTDIIEQIEEGDAKSSKKGGELQLGISTLPPLPKDCTDRNRTSPFAFTGNKFEFRMVGSTQSTSGPCFVLNTIVADTLSDIADELENAEDVNACTLKLLRKIVKDHKRILFNGDNYSDEWVVEAEKRGLPNIASTVESLCTIMDEENVKVFEKHGILSKTELHARQEVLLEAYSMMINVEARTMLNMAKRQILPGSSRYSCRLGNAVSGVVAAGVNSDTQKNMLQKVCDLISDLNNRIESLEEVVEKASGIADAAEQARFYRESVFSVMEKVRESADELEEIVDTDLWPLPSYAEMLFIK